MHPFKKLVHGELGHSLPPDQVQAYVNFYALGLNNVQHQLCPIQSGQWRVMVQTFTPAEVRGDVLLCHGYYDHVGIYGHVIRYLLQRGLRVVTFDQPGHGLSQGEPATIDSFESYVQVVEDVRQFAEARYGEQAWHWVGQSMGGAVVMEYLARQSTVSGDVVLFAPLVRPYAWGINQWVFALAKHTIVQKKRVFTQNADNPEFLSFLRDDPLQAHVLPVAWVQAMVDWFTGFEQREPMTWAPRIIQGHLDRTVDWQYNEGVLRRLFPQAQWLALPTGRHHLVNESAELRAQMWQWLDQQVFL